MISIIWFGISSSALSLEWMDDCKWLTTCARIRTYSRRCWLPTREPFPPFFLDNRTLILIRCLATVCSRSMVPSESRLVFAIMMIPFSFATDWESCRGSKIIWNPVLASETKGKYAWWWVWEIFFFPDKKSNFLFLWCQLYEDMMPGAPMAILQSLWLKDKTRMLKIAKGTDRKPRFLTLLLFCWIDSPKATCLRAVC